MGFLPIAELAFAGAAEFFCAGERAYFASVGNCLGYVAAFRDRLVTGPAARLFLLPGRHIAS